MSKRRSGLAIQRRVYRGYCQQVTVVNGTGSQYTYNLTEISIPGSIYDSGNANNIVNILDDGNVPIPMGNMAFNFFGVNRSNNIYWSSNNALIFGNYSNNDLNLEPNIPRNLLPSILIGNYDRILKKILYSNTVNRNCSITTLLITFYDYFTNNLSSSTYQYKIRIIKENSGQQKQFVEVYIISSPPSPGYSTAAISYPSGVDINGRPMDTNGNTIDSTKQSPYNITNGAFFINPCGTTFSLSSPPAGTSFVFSSDSTGTTWNFTNNAYVNV
jgi:hypothetical protein